MLGIVFQWRRADLANAELSVTLSHFKMARIDQLLEQGQGTRALSYTAELVRERKDHWRAAMLGMSIMEQERFGLPSAPPIHATDGGFVTARLSPDCLQIATLDPAGLIRFYDSRSSQPVGEPLKCASGFSTLEFSPDGKLLATCCPDGSALLWNVESRTRVGVSDQGTAELATEPSSQVHRWDRSKGAVQFSADGSYWMTLSGHSVSVWSAADASLVSRLEHGENVKRACFSEDGRTVMTASGDRRTGRVRSWSSASGAEIGNLEFGPLADADLSPDAKRMVISGGGQCAVYDATSGDLITTVANRNGEILQAEFSPDGRVIATVGRNHWARLWDAGTGLPVGPEMLHNYLLNGATFSADGRWFVTWSADATARVWNAQTGEPVSNSLLHSSSVGFAQLGRRDDGPVIMTIQSPLSGAKPLESTAQLWELHPQKLPRKVSPVCTQGLYSAVVFSPDGQLVASSFAENQLWLCDTNTGQVINGPISTPDDAYGLLFTPDGKRLIGGSPRGWVYMVSVPDGKPLMEPFRVEAGIHGSDITHDGELFALGLTNHRVQIRNTATGELLHEYSHEDQLNSASFSPRGTLLVSGSHDNTAIVFDTVAGQIISHLKAHRDEVMWAEFHPDGRRVVTASRDFSARVWDARTGQQIVPPLQHRAEVLHAEFSPDGRVLATASRDQTVGLWDAETGTLLHPFLEHKQAVRNVRFSSDGKRLLSLAFDGPRVWDVTTGSPLTVQFPLQIQGGIGLQCWSSMPKFTPDGQSFMVGSDTRQATLWQVSVPPPKVPAWFADFMEAVAGQRLQPGQDIPGLVPADVFLELRDRILRSHATDEYTLWAQQWLRSKWSPAGSS